MLAEKTAGKRILPRMVSSFLAIAQLYMIEMPMKFWNILQLIKKKVPTCVRVKYQTQTERWKGKKKQDPKSNAKKEEIEHKSNSSAKESESVKGSDAKLEQCEETKSEKHEEAQLENNEKSKDEKEEKGEGECSSD